MANGTDAEGIIKPSSEIRPGAKREFLFAMQTQSEYGCLGRTRSSSSKSNAGPLRHARHRNRKQKTDTSKKRRKGEEDLVVDVAIDKEVETLSEEEAKSDVVDSVVEVKEGDDVEEGVYGGAENGIADLGLVNSVDAVSGDDNAGHGRREAEDEMVGSEKETENGVDGGQRGERKEDDVSKLLTEFDKNSSEEFDGMLIDIDEGRQRDMEGNGVEKNKIEESEQLLMDSEVGRCENQLLEQACNKVNGGCMIENGKTEVVVNVVADGPVGETMDEPGKVIGLGVVEDVLESKGKNIGEEGSSVVGSKMGDVPKSTKRVTRSMLKATVDTAPEDVQEGGDDGGSSALAERTGRRHHIKLKDLLALGILEGLNVRYIRSKGRSPGITGLQGIIKGLGVLCFCDQCKGSKVVTPNIFEIHAGSSNKHPAENIYLVNDKNLRDVLDVWKDAQLDKLEEDVRTVVGSSVKTEFCLNCRVRIMEASKGVQPPALLCNKCIGLKESQVVSVGLAADTTEESPESKSVRRSSRGTIKSSSPIKSSTLSKFHGQITKKDLRKHKLIFEEGGLEDGTEVAYIVCGKKMLEGYKMDWGIYCFCCNSVVSPSQFEAHAGFAQRRKPFHHMYMSNGVSLHEFSVALSRERTIATVDNDELCGLCSDGGTLLCCDTCPRAYHYECLGVDEEPSGPWYCRYCDESSYKKGKSVDTSAVRRVPVNRCSRKVNKKSETEYGGCFLCRERDFCSTKFTNRTVMLCEQCEREYHVGCLKDKGMEDLKELPKDKWFCHAECRRVNKALQLLIDRGEEKLPNDSLNVLLKKKHEDGGSDSIANIDVRWRVLRGNSTAFSDGTRKLLVEAVTIFHDRFNPITEGATHRDLIPMMAFGKSKKGGQDYHGMYCAILTVNRVVVSAGIFRVFGEEVAELPLVATKLEYSGQGYFQCLFHCLEKLFSFLRVKKLVLPSATETESIWTNKFGFEKMPDDEVLKWRNDYPLMIFEGTSVLHKEVPKSRVILTRSAVKVEK